MTPTALATLDGEIRVLRALVADARGDLLEHVRAGRTVPGRLLAEVAKRDAELRVLEGVREQLEAEVSR